MSVNKDYLVSYNTLLQYIINLVMGSRIILEFNDIRSARCDVVLMLVFSKLADASWLILPIKILLLSYFVVA